jgi:hypothetical protein
MVGVGIIEEDEDEERSFRWYSRDGLSSGPPIVDQDELVNDAHRLLGVPADVAELIFEKGVEFLRMRGLVE